VVGAEPEPLPDEAYVVRGGVMDPRDLRVNADDHHLEMMEEHGSDEWAISVYSVPDRDADSIAIEAPFGNKQIRVATVGDLRAAGYDVTPSPWVHPLHADLRFAREPTDDDFEALRQIFAPARPRPNPEEEAT
jgi:hypothetical protein